MKSMGQNEPKFSKFLINAGGAGSPCACDELFSAGQDKLIKTVLNTILHKHTAQNL